MHVVIIISLIPNHQLTLMLKHLKNTLWPDFTRTGTTGTHTHTTDGNDIRPHTVQEHNERTSTEINLVTAQSTAHEPPEDGSIYGPKYVEATMITMNKKTNQMHNSLKIIKSLLYSYSALHVSGTLAPIIRSLLIFYSLLSSLMHGTMKLKNVEASFYKCF
jgi:hypothetical protein